jgi:hypothetical protein
VGTDGANVAHTVLAVITAVGAMADRHKVVGHGELMKFFCDLERFPAQDVHGVAAIAIVLAHMNFTRGHSEQYTAFPSLELIAAMAGSMSVNTARDRLRMLSPWLAIHARPRTGSRQAPNTYDARPAVAEILRNRRPRARLRVIAGGRSQPPPKMESDE